MTDTNEHVRESVASYMLKHGSDVFDELEAADWIRADVEQLPELSPSERDALIATGVHMVRATIMRDRMTTRREMRDAMAERWLKIIVTDAPLLCGSGWLPLLERAAERVQAYRPEWRARIAAAKEKFGCLVVHIVYDDDERGSRSEIERLREEIRLTSLSVCEVCGRPGRLRMAGYSETVCDAHAVEMGVMRDDDGLYADPWTWNEPDARPSRSETLVLGARSMQAFFDDVAELEAEAATLSGRPQELLAEYAGYFVDSAKGAVVKVEYLTGYVRGEIDGWPDVLALSEEDRKWLRGWLMKMILAEYDRVRRKQQRP